MGKSPVVPFSTLKIICLLAGSFVQGAVAQDAPPAPPPAAVPALKPDPPAVQDFAGFDICGQVLALTADDAGRIFSATTRRAFGRGTVTAGSNAVLQREDKALRSVVQREQTVSQWLATGRLAPLLKSQEAFYKSKTDGPANFLTKYSESVRWLADTDRNGTADAAEEVAGSFRDPMEGPGSALLALPGGHWLYGCPPMLWRLEDRNSDQRAEERSQLAEGFGLKNDPWGSDLHALLEAPDGWIYFAMGGRGYLVTTSDGVSHRGMGEGAIFRCRPDGRELAILATGLRNPVGLAMLPDGRLIAVDEADPGGKSQLLLVVPGADYGWREEEACAPGEGPWFPAKLPEAPLDAPMDAGRPQWSLSAISALEGMPSGVETLPNGSLLISDRQEGGKGGLFRLSVTGEGTGLQVSPPEDVWRGGAVLAMTQDADGKLYFADWGDKVDASSQCKVRLLANPGKSAEAPAGKEEPESASRLITQRLPELPVKDLKTLLEHPSPRVRLRARQRLESMNFQDSLEALLQVARRSKMLPARLHGLWGAATVARQDPVLLNVIAVFLRDPEPAMRAAAATLLGEGQKEGITPLLREALTNSSLTVRLAASTALAQRRDPGLMEDLLNAGSAEAGRDPAFRSSLASTMAATVPAATIAGTGAVHPEARARLIAVLALRQQRAGDLVDFLTDVDPVVATEAARAIYDLPVMTALPALAALLDQSAALPEALTRRALAAAWYLGTTVNAGRVAAVAKADTTLPALRGPALDLLENWDQVEFPEPIWKRPTNPLPRQPGEALTSLQLAAAALKSDDDTATATKASAILTKLGPLPTPASWLAVVTNPAAPEPARLAAWQALAPHQEVPTDTVKALTLPPAFPALRAEARSLLMRRDPKSAAALTLDVLATGSTFEKQQAIRTLDRLPGNGNDNEKLLLELSRRISSGVMEPGIQVEVLEALQRRDIQSRGPWRAATEDWNASLNTDADPLAPWRMCMENGDPEEGRVLFETHPDANCLSCHSLNGRGGLSGPDLDDLGERLTSGGLLESLVHPSTKFARGYEPKTPQDPDLQSGTTPLSPMPPLGTILTLRELRDLIAWLQTLGKTSSVSQ